jgi:hypothetical protein
MLERNETLQWATWAMLTLRALVGEESCLGLTGTNKGRNE